MKVLYAIQGTGNGHVARAREIVPVLEQMCDLDLLISGIQADGSISQPIKSRYKGMSFIFGKKGGVDIWETYRKNRLFRIWRELQDFPAKDYDLVINDFEPISAWAAKLSGVRCVSLSHQCAVLAPEAPKPENSDPLGKAVLQHYTPTSEQYGFHFERYSSKVYTPVIRREVRGLETSNKGHYTVYLPAYSDEWLLKSLKQFPEVKWEVFSRHNKQPRREGGVHIQPVNNDKFVKSLVSSEGMLCGAGFEAPAEALFLNKKVLAIPMKGQYEQHCNAAGLKQLGVPVIPALTPAYYDTIRNWLEQPWNIQVDYPDEVQGILEDILGR